MEQLTAIFSAGLCHLGLMMSQFEYFTVQFCMFHPVTVNQ